MRSHHRPIQLHLSPRQLQQHIMNRNLRFALPSLATALTITAWLFASHHSIVKNQDRTTLLQYLPPALNIVTQEPSFNDLQGWSVQGYVQSSDLANCIESFQQQGFELCGDTFGYTGTNHQGTFINLVRCSSATYSLRLHISPLSKAHP